jgi:arylsulfatase
MCRQLTLFIFILLLTSRSFAQYSPQPKPSSHFTGKLGVSVEESQKFQPDYELKAAAGAPNVVLIMLDDVGFSTSSTFGGMAETPTFESLASNGLKFTNFHTTGLCAPSRSALLTGRNHHSVRMGHFTETAFDAPGYDAYMLLKATIEVLRETGTTLYRLENGMAPV